MNEELRVIFLFRLATTMKTMELDVELTIFTGNPTKHTTYNTLEEDHTVGLASLLNSLTNSRSLISE